ncbi:MAG: hypothetical protein HY521_12110 [Proteobacteria bacterium]|nr:hypothetical protein [Pseudomonadota bacterium]
MGMRLIGVGVFAALMALALGGSPAGRALVDSLAGRADAWLWSQAGLIAYPSLLLVLAGYGLGFYVAPALRAHGARRLAGAGAAREIKAIEPLAGELLADLGRAYERWRESDPGLPAELGEFLDAQPFPAWLPTAGGTLAASAGERRREGGERLLDFCWAVSDEVEEWRSERKPPSLLDEEACVRLAEAEADLARVLGGVAGRMGGDGGFGFDSIRAGLERLRRAVKALAVLAAAGHAREGRPGDGDVPFYRLTAMLFRPD